MKQACERLAWLQKYGVSKFNLERLEPVDVSRFRLERLPAVSRVVPAVARAATCNPIVLAGNPCCLRLKE